MQKKKRQRRESTQCVLALVVAAVDLSGAPLLRPARELVLPAVAGGACCCDIIRWLSREVCAASVDDWMASIRPCSSRRDSTLLSCCATEGAGAAPAEAAAATAAATGAPAAAAAAAAAVAGSHSETAGGGGTGDTGRAERPGVVRVAAGAAVVVPFSFPPAVALVLPAVVPIAAVDAPIAAAVVVVPSAAARVLLVSWEASGSLPSFVSSSLCVAVDVSVVQRAGLVSCGVGPVGVSLGRAWLVVGALCVGGLSVAFSSSRSLVASARARLLFLRWRLFSARW